MDPKGPGVDLGGSCIGTTGNRSYRQPVQDPHPDTEPDTEPDPHPDADAEPELVNRQHMNRQPVQQATDEQATGESLRNSSGILRNGYGIRKKPKESQDI